MRDDFNSPDWAAGHTRLSAAIDKAIQVLMDGFDRLHRYQFSAPWRDDTAQCRTRR